MTAILLYLVALLSPRECTAYVKLCREHQARCDDLRYPLVQRQPHCDRYRRCMEDYSLACLPPSQR